MKLQQLRYLAAVVQSDLNITAAAVKLRATQSAISKQLKLLEDELGFDPFNAEEAVEFPVTFGDFVRLYENSAG